MVQLRATYFGPGRPPQGEPILAGIDPGGLLVPLQEGPEVRIPFEQLTLSSGGFDHDQIILTWSDAAGTASLVLADPDSKKKFLSLAPPSLTASSRRKIGGIRKQNWAGGIFFAFLILIPLLLALGLWQRSDRIAVWVVDRIPVDTEKQFGDLVYQQTQIGLTILSEGESVKAVEDIGKRLTEGERYPFEWHVAEDPAINAFAIPGGHVVVFTGLIEAAESPEELAGVLAHEIEHVTRRHSLRGLVHSAGWQAVVTIVLGEWGGGLGPLASEMGRLRFGRHQESEADLNGLARLKKAGISPSGMVTFFEKLARKEAPSIPLLSTHPASADRAAALQAEIKRLGSWKGKPLPYDWKKIKAELKNKDKTN